MIISLVGSNNFIILQKKKQIVDDFMAKYGNLAVENIEADFEIEKARSALLNLPFLVEKKLVVLSEPSANKELSEKLIEWLGNIDNQVDVLIIESKPDKRTAWYKYIQKNTELVSCDEIDEISTRKWILNIVREKGGEIDEGAVSLLISNTGLNQQQIYNEVNKLINYNPKITSETVNLLVEPIPKDTVFSLLEALISGNQAKTIDLYDSLRQSGIDANEILAMLGWQLHTILLVKSSQFEKNENSGLHPFVVQKNISIAKRLSFKDFEKLLDLIISAELSIKKNGLAANKVVNVLLYELLDQIKK